MGREIYFQGIKKYVDELNNEHEIILLETDSTCGRCNSTNYIATIIYNQEHLEDEEPYYIDFKIDDSQLDEIIINLREYADKDFKEIDSARETLNDLKIARKNVRRLKDFDDFTDAINNVKQWLDSEGYSTANMLLKDIQIIQNKESYIQDPENGQYQYPTHIRIIISE